MYRCPECKEARGMHFVRCANIRGTLKTLGTLKGCQLKVPKICFYGLNNCFFNTDRFLGVTSNSIMDSPQPPKYVQKQWPPVSNNIDYRNNIFVYGCVTQPLRLPFYRCNSHC